MLFYLFTAAFFVVGASAGSWVAFSGNQYRLKGGDEVLKLVEDTSSQIRGPTYYFYQTINGEEHNYPFVMGTELITRNKEYKVEKHMFTEKGNTLTWVNTHDDSSQTTYQLVFSQEKIDATVTKPGKPPTNEVYEKIA